MKKLFLLIPFLFLISSCEKPGELTKDALQNTIVPSGAVLKYTGVFMPTSGINVNGQAKIYLENGNYQLQLDNFSISSGPDLKVYLSKSATPNEFINLGNLTSATVYNIPIPVDFSQYKYVLIHCQQYNHLFAIAQLIEN